MKEQRTVKWLRFPLSFRAAALLGFKRANVEKSNRAIHYAKSKQVRFLRSIRCAHCGRNDRGKKRRKN